MEKCLGDLRNILEGLNRLSIPNDVSVSPTVIDQIDMGSVEVHKVLTERTSEIELNCHYEEHLACLWMDDVGDKIELTKKKGVNITSGCWKFLPCQAKCSVSKTNKTSKTSE